MEPRGNSAWVSWIRIFWKSTNLDNFGSRINRARFAHARLVQIAGWVYWKESDKDFQLTIFHFIYYPSYLTLNCCSTFLITVWQSRHLKVPETSSGWTGWVLTTCPEIRMRVPTFVVDNSRTLNLVGTSVRETKNSLFGRLISAWSFTKFFTARHK